MPKAIFYLLKGDYTLKARLKGGVGMVAFIIVLTGAFGDAGYAHGICGDMRTL